MKCLNLCAIQIVVIAGASCRLIQADQPVEFNRDIRPILAANCFECHGFDAKHRQADLRLDSAEGAYSTVNGSPAITPGNLQASELWLRVTSSDSDLQMPPPDSKKQLKPEETELLRRWILEGATYQKHWAFEVPVAVEPPKSDDPLWNQSPIDAFLIRKMRDNGLKPQALADKPTLIRRVAFTLTGLPPTVAEVNTFLADTSADAYEQMVNRYLASSRYGEEMARHWLDVARYADTHGLHLDNEREMWSYRDWVIRAFNQNLPFDDFTTWQIAGDLIPDATTEQLVATGFNRCNVTTSEGGSIADEWLYRYAVDRASTTMQTWMGLTAGCAVCHDHKYDPITTRDFYSMYAFYYSSSDPAMDGNVRNTRPFISVPTDAQSAALAEARKNEAGLREQLTEALNAIEYTDPATDSSGANQELFKTTDIIFDDVFCPGTKERNTSRDAAKWIYAPSFGAKSGTRILELGFGSKYDLTLEFTTTPVTLPSEGQLEFWLRVDGYERPETISVRIDDGAGNKQIVWGNAEPVGVKSGIQNMGPVPDANIWTHVSVALEELGCRQGGRIKSLVFSHSGGRIWIDSLKISGMRAPKDDPMRSLLAWWKTCKDVTPDGVPSALAAILKAGPKDDLTKEQRQQLLDYFQQSIQRPTAAAADLQKKWRDAVAQITIIRDQIPGTMVFGELEKPRDAFVMQRGQYDKPGEKVEPAVPVAFASLKLQNGQPLPAGQRANRLDLARWFLDEENPLTSRVTVNRFWQQVFGIGLVRTSDDFGSRGDLPSHPELLDWLAVDFRQSNWDVKRLMKNLVMTAAFRQQSVIAPDVYEVDPGNRLLAHGARLRLDAEQLRDNALFVSGLIDLTMGGQGVKPYQPPGIWEPVGYQNSNTRFYIQDHSSALYRRSVYCFLKRTAPPPFMSNFDGPNREQFCSRRERSNTPLQALQLMNDVQHFEAARALAERVIEEGGRTPESRMNWLFQTVLSRHPEQDEMKLLTESYSLQYSLFESTPAAAEQAIHVGESTPKGVASPEETAAWTIIANLVLNLDETIMRN
ncbi:MAG: PSD1 domain-containing protein [Planctomycetaceae bacterium]|nr:PSD1 domain-containing protein [Planctomycetaceae bacterium]